MLAQLEQYNDEDLKTFYNKIKLFDDPKEIKKVSSVVTQQRNSLNAINTYNNNILKLVNTAQLNKSRGKGENILERVKSVNDNTPIGSNTTELISSLQNITKLVDELSEKMRMTDLSGSSRLAPDINKPSGNIAKNIAKAAAVAGVVAIGASMMSSQQSRPDQTSNKLLKTTNSAIQKSEQRLETTKVSEQSFANQFAEFMGKLFTGVFSGTLGAIGAIGGAIGGGFSGEDYSNLKPAGDSAHAGQAMQFFMSQGWTKEQAAGIVGNLQAESGKNLDSNAVGDNGRAYGIAQWHADRQANFTNKAKFGKIAGSSFEDQLKFVQWELTNTESAAGKKLKSAKTPEEAAAIIDKLYERSAGFATGQRIANAIALAGGDYKNTSKNSNLSTSDARKGTIWKGKDDSGLITFVSKTNDPRTGGVKYETWTNQDSTHYPISEADAKTQIQTRGLSSSNTTAEKSATKTSGAPLTNNSAKGLLKFTARTGSEEHFNRLNPETKKAILAAAAEYKQATGKLLIISSGERSYEEQKRLYDQSVRNGTPGMLNGNPVAKPGKSNHGKGWAADILADDEKTARRILEKHGMMWFGENDRVHYTLKGHGEGGGGSSGGQMQAAPRTQKLSKTATETAIGKSRKKRNAPTMIVRNHMITKTNNAPAFAMQRSQSTQTIRPTTEYYDYLV